MLTNTPGRSSIGSSPLESQPGRPLQEQDPLVRLLIVPEALGRGVALGDDPLDAEAKCAQKRLDEFLGQIGPL
jgi:hypothetical protein